MINNSGNGCESILDLALELQNDHGWITEADLYELSQKKQMPVSKVYETLSFYSMIHLSEPAKIKIEVCRGTSCFIADWEAILNEIRAFTGAEIGEYSADGLSHAKYVECLGHCETAPNVVVNGRLYTSVTPESIREILKEAAEQCV